MKPTWKTILLFIIGCQLVGCTDPPLSQDKEVVNIRPLQSGLWLPEAHLIRDTTLVTDTTIIHDTIIINNTITINNSNDFTKMPPIYIVNADREEVISIEGRKFPIKYPATARHDGVWSLLGRSEKIWVKEESLQLEAVTARGNIIYTRAELKTKFHWSVKSIEDFDTLLQETSNWQEVGSDRRVVFYKPNCPQNLEKDYQAFYKTALVFETLPEPNDHNNALFMHSQELLFNYTGELLYFFLENKVTFQLERYVVISMTPDQWTLRSLRPPYSTILWNRIEEPSQNLKKLLIINEERLAKRHKYDLENCD